MGRGEGPQEALRGSGRPHPGFLPPRPDPAARGAVLPVEC